MHSLKRLKQLCGLSVAELPPAGEEDASMDEAPVDEVPWIDDTWDLPKLPANLDGVGVDNCSVSLKDNLAVQVADYEERLELYDCVDKTGAINAFIKETTPQHLVLRPRRTGKTSFLTMFRTFFEKGPAEDMAKRRALFCQTPTSIGNLSEVFEQHFASYAVINLDMSSVRGNTWEEMREQFDITVYNEFDRQKRLGYLNDSGIEFISRVSRGVLEGTMKPGSTTMRELARSLHIQSGRKVVVLIDEYDTPITEACEGGYLQEAVKFFSAVYGGLLKNNTKFIFGAILAGILHVQQTGFLSGLNSLKVFSLGAFIKVLEPIDVAYAKGLLFTAEEVETLFKHYNEKKKYNFTLPQLMQWYGGYYAAGIELFNPWSVSRALQEGVLCGYWTGSGIENILMRNIMKKPEFRLHLEALLKGKCVGTHNNNDNPKIGIDDDMDEDDILETLYMAGYLIKNESNNTYRIPNVELSKNFYAWTSKLLSKGQTSFLNRDAIALFDACVKGTTERLTKELKKFLKTHAPPKMGHAEDCYHNFLMAHLQHGSYGRYSVKSEAHGGGGRMDIVLMEYGGDHAVLIELKAAKSSSREAELERLARNAIEQVDHKEYRLGLEEQYTKLTEYGIAIRGKDCKIMERKHTRSHNGSWTPTHAVLR